LDAYREAILSQTERIGVALSDGTYQWRAPCYSYGALSMHNLMKRRFKKKLRSCAMCKPHKTGGSDRRGFDRVKADLNMTEQLEEWARG